MLIFCYKLNMINKKFNQKIRRIWNNKMNEVSEKKSDQLPEIQKNVGKKSRTSLNYSKQKFIFCIGKKPNAFSQKFGHLN